MKQKKQRSEDPRKDRLNDLLGQKVHVVVDRPIGYLHEDTVYPINYGYLPGVMGGDGEEQDAYILGVDKPLTTFTGRRIAIIHRRDDVETKWVLAPEGMSFTAAEIMAAVRFQEQYFDSYIELTED